MSTITHRGDVPTSETSASSRRVSVWLAVALLVVGLGCGLLLGRVTKSNPPPASDLARPSVSTMIKQQIDAINSGDAARIAPFYAENATLTDIGNPGAAPIKGAAEIAKAMAGNVKLFGPFLHQPETVVQAETFVAYAGSWGDVTGGVVVFELDSDGKILNQWAIHPAG
jgi:ketosteroid isomerase-like protein